MNTADALAVSTQGAPLLAKTPRAAEIFDISPRTLFDLRRTNPELNALTIRIGRDVYFDIPRCYEWFGQFLGGGIATK